MFALKSKIIPLLLTSSIIYSTSCSKKKTVAETPKPRPVITYQVPDLETNSQRRFSGQTNALRSVNLGFEVAGRIIVLKAKRGEQYSKGDIIAQIDPATYLAELERAKAQALQAIQQLRRTQELFETGNASKADFDTAIANQRASEASQATAALAVKNTTLKMPYDGIIADVPADVNQVTSVGSPVVAVQGSVGMEFKVGVPAGLVSLIKEQQPVKIVLGALPDLKINGIASQISPTASANTTYEVTISIPSPEKIPHLRAGMDGEAIFDFPITNGAGFSIPGSCIISEPNGKNYVWIINKPDAAESLVTKTEIKIGNLTAGGHIQVLSGIKQGQRIVSKGAHRLTPGTKVSLQH